MTHTLAATYENGLLRLAHPLPLAANQKVVVTVETESAPILQAYGILGWKGDHETLRSLAEDPEFDVQESS